jgi:hypothetical protein
MLIRKVAAGAVGAVSLYLTFALQNGPDTVDANACKLARRVFSGVPDQCMSAAYDNWGTAGALIIVAVCVLILLWDFRAIVLRHVRFIWAKMQPLHFVIIALVAALCAAGWQLYRGPRVVTVAGPAPPPTIIYNAPTEEDIEKAGGAKIRLAQEETAREKARADTAVAALESLQRDRAPATPAPVPKPPPILIEQRAGIINLSPYEAIYDARLAIDVSRLRLYLKGPGNDDLVRIADLKDMVRGESIPTIPFISKALSITTFETGYVGNDPPPKRMLGLFGPSIVKIVAKADNRPDQEFRMLISLVTTKDGNTPRFFAQDENALLRVCNNLQ